MGLYRAFHMQNVFHRVHVIAHRSLAYFVFLYLLHESSMSHFYFGIRQCFRDEDKAMPNVFVPDISRIPLQSQALFQYWFNARFESIFLASHQPNSKHILNDACWWLELVHGNSTECQFEVLQPLA